MQRSSNLSIEFLESEIGAPNIRLAQRDAVLIVDTVKRLSGIAIDPKNSGFLLLRISRRLRTLNLSTIEDYMQLLNGPMGAAEARHLVEALATHTTDFFREKAHYDFLRTTALPALVALGAGKQWPLTIWSAACSIGSELWTAGMVMHQYCLSHPQGLRWSMLGTDVSRKVLARAESAVFKAEELSGLPEDMRRAYLLRSRAGAQIGQGATVYRIIPDLRNKAAFKWANLVDLDQGFNVKADVAFLRNVLIYFKQGEKESAITNVLSQVRPGGYLITGHAEAIANPPPYLTQIGPSIYQKAADAG